MSGSGGQGRLAAVLGPTNTGKTHLAIERMLAHGSGMIGLPLRLLAREVYDKVVKAKGERAAALITGEEKIAPETARYFVCTVEAMPLDRRVEFLAIDEVQLAADPDRGHVFTDRILRARGLGETMLLGSDTMRPMLRRLAPEAELIRRERLSTLSYAGHRKLTKLPKRSAVVAFSSEEVYAIAELIRRQRGGAAVIMGALSPRTRNAQAALYQSGEVDFLVATDAIGMGLNMDVDHVAFASRAKFDGRRHRPLRADEIAQIAGRAGRFRADGAFGETGSCPHLEEETIERVEGHVFETIEAVEWRSAELDFSSVRALIASLEAPPKMPGLLRVRGALDEDALRRLAQEDELMGRVQGAASVRRLWDACLTPDFRKTTPYEHARLVGQIARHLLSPAGRLPEDWIARELARLDRTEGDLDALQARLAHVRTWTYAANRPDWLADAAHWRGRAREIEDRLSDTLHDLLTQRFIDRRTSALVRGLRREDALLAGVSADGEVTVEGHFVGRLEGFEFKPDPTALGKEGKAVRYAALKALAPEVTRRLMAAGRGEDADFSLDAEGRVRLAGAPIAKLAPSADTLTPRARLVGGEAGDARAAQAALARVEAWLSEVAARDLAPLFALREIAARGEVSGPVRGLAYRLLESAGALDRRAAADLLAGLSSADRRLLATLGVRLGRCSIYLPALTKPGPARLHGLLLQAAGAARFIPPGHTVSAPLREGLPWASYAAAGWRPVGPLAVRLDRLERLASRLFAAPRLEKAVQVDVALAKIIGAEEPAFAAALKALGWRPAGASQSGVALWRPPRLSSSVTARADRAPEAASPFAALATLSHKPRDAS